jgi:hypothetical protein
MTDVASVVKALEPIPHGYKTLEIIALYIPRVDGGVLDKSAVWDLDSAGSIMPFADEWQRVVSARVDAWFAAYKTAGGDVDVVMLDEEALIFGFGHVFSRGGDNAALFEPWQRDPRWPAFLAELNAAGEAYGVSFDNMTAAADTACCNSGGCQPGCDTTPNYYVRAPPPARPLSFCIFSTPPHLTTKHIHAHERAYSTCGTW